MAMLTPEQKLGTLMLEHQLRFTSDEGKFLHGLEDDRLDHVPTKDNPDWEPTRQQDDKLTDIYNRVKLGHG